MGLLPGLVALVSLSVSAGSDQGPTLEKLRSQGLTDLGAFSLLSELTAQVGPRLSGSPGAAKAVLWTETKMKTLGLTDVHQVPCTVPRWVRGDKESGWLSHLGRRSKLNLCALGGSVATPKGGVTAEVVEVRSLAEAEKLGVRGKGKIVFFNRGFDPKLSNTFEAYGGAVDQRVGGAMAATQSGAVAVLVRSMTLAKDDEPHTGAMRYGEGRKIPAAALGIQSADRLSAALKKGRVKVRLELSCKTLPDVPSASVAGEIRGSVNPESVIVLGGHLDSWDLGVGAHDDGSGIAQALEALRLIKKLGLKPKRTLRAVAFMNEENGLRGALAYAARAKTAREQHTAAIESDSGGFMPRAFGASPFALERARQWLPHLENLGITRITEGGGDADIAPLGPLGTALFSLEPENQRYFDYHHSRNDTLDKVNPRELEFGAIAMATLAWLLSEEGL
ncbi:MAG: M20/M25/M40 family metallo-hydrolase [Armatimonadetes bacterium]|nr:M20/M25/M40 family metallo-hydrolase [Armatimonadota bacterium]